MRMEVVGRAKELGKLTTNLEGPYLTIQEVRSGTFHLQDMDIRPIQHTWNSDTLKKYHVWSNQYSTMIVGYNLKKCHDTKTEN